jgi:hypothetical protein
MFVNRVSPKTFSDLPSRWSFVGLTFVCLPGLIEAGAGRVHAGIEHWFDCVAYVLDRLSRSTNSFLVIDLPAGIRRYPTAGSAATREALRVVFRTACGAVVPATGSR